jgi:hypothetical protein
MIAYRRADVADLNHRAGELLRAAGALGRERLHLPGGAFAAGDHVVIKRNDLRRGIHNGDRARVINVDVRSSALEVDCHGHRVTLDADFLFGETVSGEPTLLHGYAITGHVAQGLTVDRAYVLADSGVSGEWAYTAMSRGREHNALYFAADRHTARDEFAPRDAHERAPLDRLVAALGSSEASTLAIDAGRPAADTFRRDICAAEHGTVRPEPLERTIEKTRRALEAAQARRAERRHQRSLGRDL